MSISKKLVLESYKKNTVVKKERGSVDSKENKVLQVMLNRLNFFNANNKIY